MSARTRLVTGAALLMTSSCDPHFLDPALTLRTSISTTGQGDDFQDGTTRNWVINLGGFGAPPRSALPRNDSTGGPAGDGDAFLMLTALGGSGSGSSLSVLNATQWSGDYSGITAITMDLNNFGPTDLLLRLGFENPTLGPSPAPPTDRAFSTAPIFVPAGSGWTSAVFPVTRADLTAALGTVTAALATATFLRLYHSPAAKMPAPGNPIDPIVAALGVDNIASVGSLVPHANTPSGSNVTVFPVAGLPGGGVATVSLTIDQVTQGGHTSVATSLAGPPPPSGFKSSAPPVYYEISTTALFTGDVRVCLGWAQGEFANESRVSLFHYEAESWSDVTDPASRDDVSNRLCGTTTSLSPFALFEVKYPFGGFRPPVANEPAVNPVRAGAAVPVRFGLGGDRGPSIFAPNHPQSRETQCDSGAPVGSMTETVNPGQSGLTYDAASGLYTYVWKTESAWAGSCRELRVGFDDGEVYTAQFTMR